MRMLGLVLGMTLMLAWTGSTWAEGSWTLWIKRQPRGSQGYWDLWARYPSQDACLEGRRSVLHDTLVKDMLRHEAFKTEEQLQQETDTIAARDVRHRCLPDATDPRGTE